MGWHVIVTNYREENLAHDEIQELGLEVFLPKMRRIRPTRYRLADPFLLILPGYIFVQWDHDRDRHAWRAITRQRGVKSILGLSQDGAHVTPVRGEDFKRLQELAADMSKDIVIGSSEPTPLDPGTVVRILWAAMPGAIGKIEFDNGIRADVLLMAAGVASKISLPRELIETLVA